MKLRKQNRINSKKAKKRLFWCNVCDHNLVGQHGKCGHCGAKQTINKQKGN